MKYWEIIIIVLLSSYVIYLVASIIYKKVKHIPTGECSSCKYANNGKALKEYYYSTKCNNNCTCGK